MRCRRHSACERALPYRRDDPRRGVDRRVAGAASRPAPAGKKQTEHRNSAPDPDCFEPPLNHATTLAAATQAWQGEAPSEYPESTGCGTLLMTLQAILLIITLAAAPSGQITERVVCETDPTYSYALFLPPGYTSQKRWPVVFLMDPRGRAMVPMNLFSAAAGRRGYILISSYDTRSDGPAEVNVKALSALLPETERRYPVDPRRLYLAGFSGTARAAWVFATSLKGHVAGIIGFGGGFPPEFTPTPNPGFVFFGGAGTTDFNYEEMLALDMRLQRLGMPHRFRPYPGSHSWGTEEICSEAIDWMEIQAIRAGLRDGDNTLVAEFFSQSTTRAHASETGGRTLDAAVRLRETAADLEGLCDLADTIPRAAALEKLKGFRQAASQLARHASQQKAYESRLSTFITKFHAAIPPPALSESLSFLQIDSLKKRAVAQENPDDALAAQRLLELVAVHTSYNLPGDYLERKDPGRALAVLRIAEAIEPDSPGVCMGLARARAQIGQKIQALEDLRRAVASGWFDAAGIEADPWLAPLREEAGYRELLDRLKRRVDE